MKNYYKYLFLFLFLFSIFSMSSCRKPIEKRIIGKWKKVNVDDMTSTYLEYWVFSADETLFIHKDTIDWNDASKMVDDTCRYLINSRLRRDYIYADIMDKKSALWDYNGVWEIIYLKKNTMMLVKRPGYESIFNQGHREVNTDRVGGVMFREFTKME